MEIHPLFKYQQDALDTLLASIPFYKAVKAEDQEQYELLMTFSQVIEYAPGEVLARQSAEDRWLYFMLRGQMLVIKEGDHEESANETTQSSGTIISRINPGEVFGDMAFFLRQNAQKGAPNAPNPDRKRSPVSVMADPDASKILLFGTNMLVFGQLHDFKRIKLATKLSYYRNAVHNLRWKLEMFRAANPDVSFANDHRKVKMYLGEKDSLSELEDLHEQAVQLSIFVVKWNRELNTRKDEEKGQLDVKALQSLS